MFGPPLSRPITSADVEYAFRRMATAAIQAQYGGYYYGLIEGLEAPSEATEMPADITGIETPDDKTIIFHLTRLSLDFVFLMAMPATSPMPEEVAGCFMEAGTYGRYLIPSGPYMYEGTDALDPSSCEALAASGPIAGFDPEDHSYFVRNPDYDPATDDPAVRANYVDRITIDLNTNVQDISPRSAPVSWMAPSAPATRRPMSSSPTPPTRHCSRCSRQTPTTARCTSP